jgi:hypothetical protein
MSICRSLRDAFAIAIGLCCLSVLAIQPARAQKSPRDMPVYKVDPFWPKPLPNKWILQGIPVLVTDKNDHIWAISRPDDIKPDESRRIAQTYRRYQRQPISRCILRRMFK